jgi:non-ribosomal peptide synthetase component E (peptide arylation enzyme)
MTVDRATLDDLFRRAAVANPEDIALADDRRQLTYAEADRVVWAIAARLRALGLQTDAVVGVQLPNTVESVLALLGVLRAGLIAAPLPMLWRETEITAALSAAGAKAIVTTARIGTTNHGALAGRAAAALFSIRHVLAFGENLPDGIIPLDDVFADAFKASPAPPRDGDPAAHAAVITFEPTPRGIRPVPRTHRQLIAGGLAVLPNAATAQDVRLLSATPPSSFAGLSVTLLPWLLSGGRLVLHQPFDAALFSVQQRTHDCNVVVVPGPLAAAVDRQPTVIALWRAPERLDPLPLRGPIIDVRAFGEFGLVATPRAADGGIAPLVLGAIHPGAAAQATTVETRRTPGGTLALHGAMVAAAADNAVDRAADGFVDTGYPCRIDPELGSLVMTGPQPGMIGIGGYRIARGDLDALAAALPPGSVVAALPDSLLGQRLRGHAVDPAAAVAAGRTLIPLLAEAFARPAAESR